LTASLSSAGSSPAPTAASANGRLSATSPAPIEPGSLRAWVIALRPRTLPVSVSPVLLGAAFAYARTGTLDAGLFVLALLVSMVMQVITNLQNDVGYTVRGGERHGNRTGLPRATAEGWLTPAQVYGAIGVAIAVALALGLPFVLLRGWPALAMGAASIIAALAYMGGPRPIAYTPFGEAVVFVFFGLVAVVGSDWVLSGSTGPTTLLGAAAIGAVAAAVLVVNNHRDIDHDRSVGRRTFAVVHGAGASTALFGALLVTPFVLIAPLAFLQGSLVALPAALVVGPAYGVWRDFRRLPPGMAFNGLLFRTAMLELGLAVLLAAGVALTHPGVA
jgi:1,4-dihydroxy-2-naphthoate octaprenyltransferase